MLAGSLCSGDDSDTILSTGGSRIYIDGVGEKFSWAGLAFRIPTLYIWNHESEGEKLGGGQPQIICMS